MAFTIETVSCKLVAILGTRVLLQQQLRKRVFFTFVKAQQSVSHPGHVDQTALHKAPISEDTGYSELTFRFSVEDGPGL